MVAFFESMEISAMDAWTLFLTLDVDGDHTVGRENFRFQFFKRVQVMDAKKCQPVLDVIKKPEFLPNGMPVSVCFFDCSCM